MPVEGNVTVKCIWKLSQHYLMETLGQAFFEHKEICYSLLKERTLIHLTKDNINSHNNRLLTFPVCSGAPLPTSHNQLSEPEGKAMIR